jgi:hypothetical protein
LGTRNKGEKNKGFLGTGEQEGGGNKGGKEPGFFPKKKPRPMTGLFQIMKPKI